MLHVDAIGKEPKFPMADQIIIEMGASDLHIEAIYLYFSLCFLRRQEF